MTTSAPSKSRSAARSTSSAAATHASLFPKPDSDAVRAMKDICGRQCLELYALSGRDGSLPKTLLGILNSVSTVLPHRWKIKASPSGRLLFQLAPLALPIDGTGSGLWRTPDASIVTGGAANAETRKAQGHAIGLHDQVNTPSMWPTPRSTDGSHGGRVTPRKGRKGGNLIEAVSQKMWPTPHGFSKDRRKSNGPSGNELGRAVNQSLLPTPTAQDAKNNGAPSQALRNTPPLNSIAGGSLNPEWVEVAHGIPHRVDRLKALGNSIVPQIAAIIGEAIMTWEKQ